MFNGTQMYYTVNAMHEKQCFLKQNKKKYEKKNKKKLYFMRARSTNKYKSISIYWLWVNLFACCNIQNDVYTMTTSETFWIKQK